MSLDASSAASEVRRSTEKGRFVVASRDQHVGEALVSDFPLLASIDLDEMPDCQFEDYVDDSKTHSALSIGMFPLRAHKHVQFSWLCPFPSCRRFHVVDTQLYPLLSKFSVDHGFPQLYTEYDGFFVPAIRCYDEIAYPDSALAPMYPCTQSIPFLLPFLHCIARLNRLGSLSSQNLSSGHNLVAFILNQYIEACSKFIDVYSVSPSIEDLLCDRAETLVEYFQKPCVSEILPEIVVPIQSSVLLILSMAMEPGSPCHVVDMASSQKAARAVVDALPGFMLKLGNITGAYQRFLLDKSISVVSVVRDLLKQPSNASNLIRAQVGCAEVMDTNLFSCQGGTLAYKSQSGLMHLHRFHVDSVFARIAMMEHSCSPSAMQLEQHQDAVVDVFPTTPCVTRTYFTLKTLHPVKKGDCLSISYRFISNLSLGQRRRETKQHYNFYCQCIQCCGIDKTRLYFINTSEHLFTCGYEAQIRGKQQDIPIYTPSESFPTVSDPVIVNAEEYLWSCYTDKEIKSCPPASVPTVLFFVLEYMQENIPLNTAIHEFCSFQHDLCSATQEPSLSVPNIEIIEQHVLEGRPVPIFSSAFRALPLFERYTAELDRYTQAVSSANPISLHVSSSNAFFLSIISKAVGKTDAFFGQTVPQYTYNANNVKIEQYPQCAPLYSFLRMYCADNLQSNKISAEKAVTILLWLRSAEKAQHGTGSWIVVDTCLCLAETHFIKANALLYSVVAFDTSITSIYEQAIKHDTTGVHKEIALPTITSLHTGIASSTQHRLQGINIISSILSHTAIDLDKRRGMQYMLAHHKQILSSLALRRLSKLQ